jgi:N-methylhydantoinase A
MIDIVSVGAGGGSIAWLDSGGMLQVGPASAGANPGPACYGLGGTQPTITDANVARGLIRPHRFLGGRHVLDRDAASQVVNQLAGASGLSAARLAEDIFRISCATMAGAIRVVSVERGYDPREYTLVAYGGAGPLHAATVADELNISRVLIPPLPGLISAYGLLAGNFQRDFARTSVESLRTLNPSQVRAEFESLESGAVEELQAQGIQTDAAGRSFGLDMRYRGQGFELTVPIDIADLEVGDLSTVEGRFHDMHRTRYGHSTPGEEVEAVTYRLSITIEHPNPEPLRMPEDEPAQPATLPIVVDGKPTDCEFHWRPGLRPGDKISGPAIVEEATSTTFVPGGWFAAVDGATNLVLERMAK